MFIVTPTLEARPSSVRSGTEWHSSPHSPPAVGPPARYHAAPLELGGPGGICGYKHGAPKGAFCLIAVTSPRVKDAYKEQAAPAHRQDSEDCKPVVVSLESGPDSFTIAPVEPSNTLYNLINPLACQQRWENVRCASAKIYWTNVIATEAGVQ